jgi:hypothetical protein
MKKTMILLAVIILMIAPCTASVIKVGVPNNMEPYSGEAVQFLDPIFKSMGYEPTYVKDELVNLKIGLIKNNIDIIVTVHPDSFLSNYAQFTEAYDNVDIYKADIDYYERYVCLASYNPRAFENLDIAPRINGTTLPYDVYKKHINGTIQADNINDFINQSIINPNSYEGEEVGAIIQVVGTNESINYLISGLPSKMKISPKDWEAKRMQHPAEVWYREIDIKKREVVDNQPLVVAINKNSPISEKIFNINVKIIRSLGMGSLLQIKENNSFTQIPIKS